MGKRKKLYSYRATTSKCSDEFNDSFIDISTLSAGSNLNTSLNIVTHAGCDSINSGLVDPIETLPFPSKCDEKSPIHGISSFQRFIMSTSNSVGVGKMTIEEPTCSEIATKSEATCDSIASEDEESSLPITVSFPNILKHKRKDQKNSLLTSSPIKTLAFSPSRFLNVEKDDKGIHLNSEVSKDLSFSSSSFDAEDSGIGGSDVDVAIPLSPPSLTSTPCTRSRRKTSLQNKTCLFSSPEQGDVISNCAFSTQSASAEETNPTKTPLIRKFLNESAPRTPTPFKCPGVQTDKEYADVLESRSTHKSIHGDNNSSFTDEESSFKRPSPVSSRCRLKKTFRKSVSSKSARKALILDHEYNLKRRLFKRDENRRSDFRSDFLKNSFQISGFDQSGLIDDTAVVEKKKIVSRGKSVYLTRRTSTYEHGRSLDKKWVSVACGRSINQKVMTEAAKRYFHPRANKGSTSPN